MAFLYSSRPPKNVDLTSPNLSKDRDQIRREIRIHKNFDGM